MADVVYHLKGTNSIGPALSIDFVTDDGSSDANAKDVGQSVSTLLGCNLDVVLQDGTTLGSYTPGSQSSTVTLVDGVVVSSAI